MSFLNTIPLIALLVSAPKQLPDGPFLRPQQQRDSVLIADQLRYGVRLNGVEDGTHFQLPAWNDTLTGGVEVVKPWQIDTISFHKKANARDLEAYITITSFEEGLFDLPGITLARISPKGVVDTLKYEYQQLVVKTLPVDTATFVVNDIKGQARYPVTFREVLPWLLIGFGSAGLIALCVWLIIRYRRKKAAKIAAAKEPPHIVALRKLDALRGEKFWAPDKQKAFYSGVTDTLREYMAARFEVGAMEMTTQEIFAELDKESIDEELRKELRELFERADFIKFAKHIADREENIGVVPLAVKFVTSTYQSDLEQQSEVQQAREIVQEPSSDHEKYMPKQ